jgi:hypothetical protein
MNDNTPDLSRRQLLMAGSCGFGHLAFSGLATQQALAGQSTVIDKNHPLAQRKPHFAARAKRVIFMFMQGGPTHVDTFDHKPELKKQHGKQVNFSYDGKKFSGKLMESPFKFNPCGKSGLMMSELFPNLAKHADDLCLINSMHTAAPAHPQATIFLHTGSVTFVRPSVGSWLVYGLGTQNQNMPGFVTINPLNRLGGAQNYGAAFLPAAFQGTRINAGSNAIPNIKHPSMSPSDQRKHVDLIQKMNRELLEQKKVNTDIEGVIESYELAFRMQSTVPVVMDVGKEPQAVKEMYGIGQKETSNFGLQCLMARRLAESGVRFIEVTLGGWDQHNGLKTRLPLNCRSIDKPIAALMTDLKRRGMFDDTLIVWGGEFGRTPAEQNKFNGRKHNNTGYTMWMAGGGVKGGIRHGATDPTGWTAVENKVHIHDLHATILHLMGLDHTKLTYRYAGRDFRLTNVYGDVVHDIIA